MARKARSLGCEMDMTPMIDIVFQLIIFFVVTLKLTSDINMDILLEDGKAGDVMKNDSKQLNPFEIELDRNGRITMNNFRFSDAEVQMLLRNRVNRMGTDFPILIRADRRTPHEHVKRVMDLCTGAGVWRLSFVAVHDHKTGHHQR